MIMSASAPYTSVWTGRQYGVSGDSCYDAMMDTDGHYVDALNQRAVSVYGASNFETVLVNEIGWS